MTKLPATIGAIALLFGVAFAQDPPAERTFDLSEIAGMLRPGGPMWADRATFAAAPGAVARVNAGDHAVGATIAEIEITPRTARLLEPIVLQDETHGQRTISAGTLLFARNSSQGEVWPGREPVITDRGPLEWCLIDDAPLCIRMLSAGEAQYRESDGARVWRGPPPALQEEPATFDPPVTWRISISAIDPARGVSFESSIGRGDLRVHERGFGFVPADARINLSERYPGLAFILHTNDDGTVRVQAARPPT